jgi:hypothetical protein
MRERCWDSYRNLMLELPRLRRIASAALPELRRPIHEFPEQWSERNGLRTSTSMRCEALKTICGHPTALPWNGGNLLPDFHRAWWWLDLSWYTAPRLGSQGLYAPYAREWRCWEGCYPSCDRAAMVTAPAILAARTRRSSRDRRVGPGSSRSGLRVEESSRWHWDPPVSGPGNGCGAHA